jgi:multidrug resistance efflux pump
MAEQVKKIVEPADTAAQPEGAPPAEHLFTAKMQHEHLAAAFKNWDSGSEAEDADPETVPVTQVPIEQPAEVPPATSKHTSPKLGALSTIKRSTIIKSAIALLVALVLGWMPIQRLLLTTSAEAVINARVITVRTPISGDVNAQASRLEAGATVQAGEELLTIKNPRSDRSAVENLKRSVEQLTTSVAALQAKEAVLRRHHLALVAQNKRYQSGRVETLEKQLGELDAQITTAEAQHREFEQALQRGRVLVTKGVVTQSYLDKAVRDESAALQAISQLRARRNAAEIGLASARQGTFIMDGYNDTPQSAQRRLDVEVELADVQARLVGTTKELKTVKQDLTREQQRDQELSAAVIRANISGRVWEVMTAPGEHVNAGQVLMRLLDCASAIVTASVSERTFQKLSIGQHATFKPTDGGQPVHGWVVGLSGLATVTSNDAISSKVLTSEPYHVTLKFPELTQQAQCQVSRAGLVTFDTSTPARPMDLRLGEAK